MKMLINGKLIDKKTYRSYKPFQQGNFGSCPLGDSSDAKKAINAAFKAKKL